MNNEKCPICLNVDGGNCTQVKGADGSIYDTLYKSLNCSICGRFDIDHEAIHLITNKTGLTKIHRALISHLVCITNESDTIPPITRIWLERVIKDGNLPTPIEQASNLVRYVGDTVLETGEDLPIFPRNIHAIIGSARLKSIIYVTNELNGKGLIRFEHTKSQSLIDDNGKRYAWPTNINLTMDGWKQYMDEKKGQFSGDYGFIAMKFGETDLEDLVKHTIKPAIKEKIKYKLVDIRDISRAGVIDNILRMAIRDALFVIADLTHDNYGAYWEAGYAEGLGKPVIYICEKTKFESNYEDKGGTHFDTNHSTTVLWEKNKTDEFTQELIATLRRSIITT